MGVNEWVNLFVNNGVAIGIIVYFAIRDWKFTEKLTETLTTIKQLLEKEKEENE